MINTIKINITGTNKIFKNYDDMYKWFHNDNSSFDDLNDADKLLLIHAVGFSVYKSDFSNLEIEEKSFRDDGYDEDEIKEMLMEVDNPTEIKSLYHLVDNDGANLANIENLVFSNLDEILYRLETYHTDYFSEY